MMNTAYRFNPQLLRRAREARGLSVPGLAAKAGVSFGSVYAWEYGDRIPTSANLCKIAAALGIDPGDLFTRSDEPVAS
jgi:transcriptional regulator with XRE-family HTH domain